MTGLPGGNRTPDNLLRRQVLYPTELRAEAAHEMNGRSDRIRTYDPLVPNQMRYQTAPHSDVLYYLDKTIVLTG